MTMFMVLCTEIVKYEIPVNADSESEALEFAKDNLPEYINSIESEFIDFEVKKLIGGKND